MDTEPSPTQPSTLSLHRRKRNALRIALLGLGILLAALIYFALKPSSDERFVWLTTAELARTSQPDAFARLKFKFMNLTAPLWQWYWKSRPQITIRSSLLTLPAAAVPVEPGPPSVTNANGMRAWILPPAEWNAFKQRLKSLPEANVVSSPSFSTSDGGAGRMLVARTVVVGGKPVQVGTTVDLTPKIVGGAVHLAVGITSTAANTAPLGDASGIRTNFEMACRATVPNGGGLVIEAAGRKEGKETNYWLTVSPTAVDAKGRPIKP
jgi:hypothetical protein